MREIKFRQWDSRRKIMYEDIGALNRGSWYGFPYVSWDVYPIMQYTGLKDKNGKEIYEGDIIFRNYILFRDRPPIKETLVVSYRQDGFYALKANDKNNNPGMGRLRFYTKSYEVIGNIYENKDLLK